MSPKRNHVALDQQPTTRIARKTPFSPAWVTPITLGTLFANNLPPLKCTARKERLCCDKICSHKRSTIDTPCSTVQADERFALNAEHRRQKH
ncbi:hypothetical protein [Anatilimnocola floriformis]|uniref:hypothetical protein n=1 Tax=Anatilimnocola floriformis TaxID=2948575 RepID=UPI0020C25D54|nr:hypothetical protein [Anatilimnocola floriformis]